MMNNVDTFLLAFNLVMMIYFYPFSLYVSSRTWIDMLRCEQLGREGRVHYAEACQRENWNTLMDIVSTYRGQ